MAPLIPLGADKCLALGFQTIVDPFRNLLPASDFADKIALIVVTRLFGLKGGEVTPLFYIGSPPIMRSLMCCRRRSRCSPAWASSPCSRAGPTRRSRRPSAHADSPVAHARRQIRYRTNYPAQSSPSLLGAKPYHHRVDASHGYLPHARNSSSQSRSCGDGLRLLRRTRVVTPYRGDHPARRAPQARSPAGSLRPHVLRARTPCPGSPSRRCAAHRHAAVGMKSVSSEIR